MLPGKDGLTICREIRPRYDGCVLFLTASEDAMDHVAGVELGASHAEEILSRDYIYKTLRGIEYDGLDRAVDSKVATLRKKLGDNASLSTRIITVRGQGYLFVPDSWE